MTWPANLALDPVAVLLDHVSDDGAVTFGGIDLDSGQRVTITIERNTAAPQRCTEPPGLVLVITIGRAGTPN